MDKSKNRKNRLIIDKITALKKTLFKNPAVEGLKINNSGSNKNDNININSNDDQGGSTDDRLNNEDGNNNVGDDNDEDNKIDDNYVMVNSRALFDKYRVLCAGIGTVFKEM